MSVYDTVYREGPPGCQDWVRYYCEHPEPGDEKFAVYLDLPEADTVIYMPCERAEEIGKALILAAEKYRAKAKCGGGL